jgi:hypothetical protein
MNNYIMDFDIIKCEHCKKLYDAKYKYNTTCEICDKDFCDNCCNSYLNKCNGNCNPENKEICMCKEFIKNIYEKKKKDIIYPYFIICKTCDKQ